MSAGYGTFLYVGDVFRPLQLSLKELLEAWEGGRLGLFELVRDEVEGLLGEVSGARLVGAFLDPSSMTAVVEYVVELAGGGECSVKVVHAEDPGRALMEYYRAEREGRLAR